MSGEKLKSWTFYFTLVVIFVSSVSLIGWIFDISFLLGPDQGIIAMNPVAAITFNLCAITLLLIRTQSSPRNYSLAKVLSITAIVIGLLKLFNELVPVFNYIDEFLRLSAAPALRESYGQFAPSSAFNFILLGISLLLIRDSKYAKVTQALSIVILIVSWFSILGYIYNVPEFYGHIPYIPMSIRSAICFTCIGLAILLYFPDKGLMHHFTGAYEGSRLARLLLPTTLVVPLLLGYIRLWGHWLGLFSTEFGVSLLVVSITLIFFFVLSISMVILNKRDLVRKKQEEEVVILNVNLKEANEEVAALNEELITSNEQLYERNNQLASLNESLVAANEVIKAQSDIIIRQKDEQLNRVLDSSDNIIWSFDLTGKNENYMSRSVQRIFNKPYNELLNNRKFWFEGVVADDKLMIETAERLLEYYGKSEATYRILDKEKGIRWLYYKGKIVRNSEGKPIREDGFITDITSQKKTEEEVETFQKNLNIIFENTHEGILLMDKVGKVVLFNVSFKNFMSKVTGKQPEVGKYLWEVTTKERSEIARQYFLRALSGEVVQAEATFPSSHGIITHLLRYEPIYTNNVITNVCIISVDITVQKENEANLKSIFENTDDLFTLLDKDFRIVTFNRGSFEFSKDLLGKEIQKGKNIFEYVRDDYKQRFRDVLTQVELGNIVRYNTEYEKDSLTQWFNVSVSPVKTDQNNQIGYCITSHNITAQKNAQEKIVQSEERFRALVENTEDIIGLTDSKGKLVYVSPGVTKITGYSIEEFLELGGLTLVHDDDKVAFESFVASLFENPGHLFYIQFRSKHRQGHYQWMEGTAVNLLDKKNVNGIVTNFRDITARKNAEADKNIILQQLLNQNSELLQFSFIASHNLRGPVASMLGLFQIIDQYEMNKEVQGLLQMFHKTVGRLDDVIKDINKILDIRNNYVEQREWISFSKIAREIIQSFEGQLCDIDSDVSIDSHAIDEFFVIRSYFYSIIYNLISNAIKYKVTNRKLIIRLATFKNSEGYGFSISDNGKGIDLKKYGAKLFTLYQRFHLEVEGKGLGLFLVKTQVDALNGAIDVESSVGKGSVFIIRFPAVAE
ncbi:PAS domain S-box protein [Chryseosolibacter indicus]|uniref:histidine kinase n=1 Tax=Chryseosolibacter indicus TaxID=2782351 RepID=A0ABS5VSQ3_9BACT|nr:PAS domain S-box protein [Chryseosolibacter indicus]MBT1703804.1 PAS domain S-box protein [Chryseosolibacter indicus]